MFIQNLRSREGMGAVALEFLILTAARTGEVIGMRGEEVDFENAIWTVPASRMKTGREHVVPLLIAAVALLRKLPLRKGKFVFSGPKPTAPLSNMALAQTERNLYSIYWSCFQFPKTLRTRPIDREPATAKAKMAKDANIAKIANRTWQSLPQSDRS